MLKKCLLVTLLFLATFSPLFACSILYYIDAATGKIYAVSNEDYWYNVKPYLKIMPSRANEIARLWYGWDNFAQGGINQAGLFFDGAATPDEPAILGYSKPKGNLGDEILAKCKTVKEAVDYLEEHKVALTNGHLLFGDKTGNAMVVEWVNGQKKLTQVADNKLMITNFLLADTAKGNYPCPRYNTMAAGIDQLRQSKDTVGFKQVGSILARAVQPPAKDAKGKEGGTLYSVFTNITDMEFVLVYKLDNAKKIRLNLNKEFAANQQRTIKME